MIKDLLDRPLEKRPTTLKFDGRILYLLDDTELVRAQLFDGQDLELTDELKGRLRDQISTDEITPAYICYFFDETLGDFPYLGLRTTDQATGATEYPITRSSVKDGGFVCSVAGKRRGNGSRRFHRGRRSSTQKMQPALQDESPHRPQSAQTGASCPHTLHVGIV